MESGSCGLRYSGSLNTNTDTYKIKYTEEMKNSNILQELIRDVEKKYNTKCIFARILKLKSGGKIYDHSDGDDFNVKKFRCAIPLTHCYPDCWMNINKESYYLDPGNLYSTNVKFIHSVTNNSPIDRINIVIDLLPSKELLESIKYGKGTKIIPYFFERNNNDKLIISFSGCGVATQINNESRN